MTPSAKDAKLKFFRTEESFCRYLELLARNRGYVLVETSPLVRTRTETAPSSTSLPGQAERVR
ncbi:MAG: hypothetical protein OP8BY_1806 [Candidatus Saccharicenans subterraneus]|uniref:Uncharacterized protein n=1 Tax=Candidatus Saccharicenans subterraneus TaxID=2508984 RepID=A0A3E2BNI0_9BACT|nr:MAG: hypothetical protein OP8BY_1806 [Candidatus Saccharicenans subterraneum]